MYCPTASGQGDPHYATFDRRYYTFNGNGDFTTLEVLPRDSDVPIFSLQGRLGRVSFWGVTTHLGLAFGQPDLAFHVSESGTGIYYHTLCKLLSVVIVNLQFGMAPGFRVFQTKPEPATEITGQLQNGQPWEDATGDAVLTRSGNSLTVAFYKSGITISGNVNPRGSEYQMNFQVRVPQSFSGRTRGLLGNLDGNPTNDFYRKGQTNPLPNGISERDLYFHLITCKTRMHVIVSPVFDSVFFFQGESVEMRVSSSTLAAVNVRSLKMLTLFHFSLVN